ncbi:MAG: Crp/Fnr family transcriptional regulator [Terracidiphilus sp.]|jgi:CRP/FNR family transcriptional regulator
MQVTTEVKSVCNVQSQGQRSGDVFSKLTPEANQELNSIMHPATYPAGTVLFSEMDEPQRVFVVLDGEVKLSINSSDGKRLILRIARKGEIVGLASALSGKAYDMTAETLYPSKLAPIGRRAFLNVLMHHPEVYQMLTEEMSRQFAMACDQLRTVVLSTSAPEKVARLLLEWGQNGQTSEAGTRFRFSLTHGEIGEFIGASRETVTRTLSAFKSRRLVMFNGSTLTIPNIPALERYARG